MGREQARDKEWGIWGVQSTEREEVWGKGICGGGDSRERKEVRSEKRKGERRRSRAGRRGSGGESVGCGEGESMGSE